MKPARFVAAVIICLGAGAAQADTLVCKQGQKVERGMSAVEVLKRCGPPSSAEGKTEDLRAINPMGSSVKIGDVYTEIWRYDRGPQKPAALVVVTEGKVMSITFEN